MFVSVATTGAAAVKPGAVAVMFTVPILMALTCGCVAGVVAPAAMNTLDGVTVARLELLLARLTVTPFAGAP